MLPSPTLFVAIGDTIGEVDYMKTLLTRTERRAVVACLCFAAGICLLAGCQKPLVGNQGEALQEPGAPIAVTMVGFSLERIELEGENGPLIYEEPVLAVRLKLENKGQAPFAYQPTHTADKATNLQAPLLFVDPGPKAEPTTNITGIYLEEGLLSSQQAAMTQIQPGDTKEDVYLFQPPAQEGMDLLLTVPPALHGGKNMIKIKLPYTATPIAPPAVHKVGEEIVVGEVKVVVTGSGNEYLKLKDVNKGAGFSKDPVFKVSYKLTNTGSSALTYNPGHGQLGSALAVALLESGGKGRYMRVRFGGDREVPGQVSKPSMFAAGKTVTDFAVFERPPPNAKMLQVQIPAKLWGGAGLVRVDFPYEYKDPAKPAALTPPTEK